MATLKTIKKKIKNKNLKVLVTGAAGFIGSNLVNFLLNSNQTVIGLDNLSTGNYDNISKLTKQFKKKFKFIKGDVRNYRTCLKASKNIDIILHNAALGSVPRSIKDPLNSHSTNSTGFLNILHSAHVSNVSKLIFASSSSVYGDYKKKTKVENSLGKLLSPYAVTKKNNEDYAEVFAKIYNMKIIGLRYFNVFGKNQNPYGPYSAVIPRWINLLINKKSIEIYGDGKTSRDFCFVDNVIQANILAIIENNKNNFQIYNVSAGRETNLKNLYKKIK
jgi:UDP-N-acetylglucosamine 4-epimerase